MDAVKAATLDAQLRGQSVGRWTVERLINHGKSAAVFRATCGAQIVALKIFDDELIERYGDKTQLGRIQRELTLVGKTHPNLVEIIDGGVDRHSNNHFVVMEYLDGPNLKSCLQTVPADSVPALVEQLASAAMFLENLGLCHRDIKPENIVLLDDHQRLVLLDFGVLRPVGMAGLTDSNGIQSFVGTLQYSSPEFLLRMEEDSVDGWRALTFYQIGAVLHDLIMRRPLFDESVNPYPRLVNAVQHDVPAIQNSAVPQYLVELAGACLLKDPRVRVRLVDWSKFVRRRTTGATGESAKQRVTNRAVLARARQSDQTQGVHDQATSDTDEVGKAIISYLKEAVRSIRNDNAVFPPLTVGSQSGVGLGLRVHFKSSLPHGVPNGLTVFVVVEVLDPRAKAIALSAAACAGNRSSASPPEQMWTFFQGIYDTAAVYEAFESCIYHALDKVQQAHILAADRSHAAEWLDLQNGEGRDGSDLVDET